MAHCPFFEQGGWFSNDSCRRTGNTVSGATYRQYCNHSAYANCPFFPNKSGGGCYLTTACVEVMGRPDDCHELTVLRSFRDGWLRDQPGGAEEVAEYYALAPATVDAINRSPEREAVFRSLYDELVVPCVDDIENGRNEEARARYRTTSRRLADTWL